MQIIKLDETHATSVYKLFEASKHMGVDSQNFNSEIFQGMDLTGASYDMFCNTYLSDLETYAAVGTQEEDGSISGFIAFHISEFDPCWYLTLARNSGNKNNMRLLTDAAMEYNESIGRYKFYTMFTPRYAKVMRRFTFSELNNKRYGFFDEIHVPAQKKCVYFRYWNILYRRTLIPVDTVVRCTYLKPEFRPTELPLGGAAVS